MTGLEVRAAALEAATRVSAQGANTAGVLERAKKFEQYILTGK